MIKKKGIIIILKKVELGHLGAGHEEGIKLNSGGIFEMWRQYIFLRTRGGIRNGLMAPAEQR